VPLPAGPVERYADRAAAGSLLAAGGLLAVTRSLDQARSQGKPSASLQKEQQRLETEVRASALRARGDGRWTRAPFSPADLLDELGPAQLIEIADVDGDLYVLTCGSGRIRQFAAGPAGDAMKAADFARFALRRLASSRPGADPASALARGTAAPRG